jgi:hypothetical protein
MSDCRLNSFGDIQSACKRGDTREFSVREIVRNVTASQRQVDHAVTPFRLLAARNHQQYLSDCVPDWEPII